MAKFDLAAQILLQRPSAGNTNSVLSYLQNALGNVTTKVNLESNPQAMARAIRDMQALGKAGNRTKDIYEDMSNVLANATRRFAGISIATGTLLGLARGIKTALGEAIQFESEILKIAQANETTVLSTQKLKQEIIDVSKRFGGNALEISKTAKSLAQAGFSAQTTTASLELLSRVDLVGTFGDAAENVDGLIAIYQQFGQEIRGTAKESDFLLEKFAAAEAVSRKFAVESSDLITAVKKAGGAFAVAGGDFEELIAILTAVRASTRESAATIANGFKTIFTRLQKNETIESLQALGIELVDLKGKFVGPEQAIDKIARKLAVLQDGDIRFTQIAEEIGGVYQANRLITLLKQQRLQQEALNVARDKGNVTNFLANSDQGAETTAKKIERLNAAFFELINTFKESQTFKDILDLMIKMASSAISAAKAIEKLIPLLTAALAVPAARFASGITKNLLGGKTKEIKIGGHAEGGPIRGGSGNKDDVPAMLMGGEFVIKKKSAQKNMALLTAINNGKPITGFADGGPVENISNNQLKGFFQKQKMPQSIYEDVKKYGVTVKRANSLTDIDPSLKTKDPQGHAGKSFNDIRGLYRDRTKSIFLNKTADAEVVSHEIGHAYDYAHGRITDSKEYMEAYTKDLNKLTPEKRNSYQYYTQPGIAGRRESFAALFDSNVRAKNQKLNEDFSESNSYVNKRIKENEINSLHNDYKQIVAMRNNGNPDWAKLVEKIKISKEKISSSLVKDDPRVMKFLSQLNTAQSLYEPKVKKFNVGGRVNGQSGKDVIPAMLTAGEFVVNKKDAKKNWPLLVAMNSGREVSKFAEGTETDPSVMGSMKAGKSRSPKQVLEQVNSVIEEIAEFSIQAAHKIKSQVKEVRAVGTKELDGKAGTFNASGVLRVNRRNSADTTVPHELGHAADASGGVANGFVPSQINGTINNLIAGAGKNLVKANSKASGATDEQTNYKSGKAEEVYAEIFTGVDAQTRALMISLSDSTTEVKDVNKSLEKLVKAIDEGRANFGEVINNNIKKIYNDRTTRTSTKKPNATNKAILAEDFKNQKITEEAMGVASPAFLDKALGQKFTEQDAYNAITAPITPKAPQTAPKPIFTSAASYNPQFKESIIHSPNSGSYVSSSVTNTGKASFVPSAVSGPGREAKQSLVPSAATGPGRETPQSFNRASVSLSPKEESKNVETPNTKISYRLNQSDSEKEKSKKNIAFGLAQRGYSFANIRSSGGPPNNPPTNPPVNMSAGGSSGGGGGPPNNPPNDNPPPNSPSSSGGIDKTAIFGTIIGLGLLAESTNQVSDTFRNATAAAVTTYGSMQLLASGVKSGAEALAPVFKDFAGWTKNASTGLVGWVKGLKSSSASQAVETAANNAAAASEIRETAANNASAISSATKSTGGLSSGVGKVASAFGQLTTVVSIASAVAAAWSSVLDDSANAIEKKNSDSLTELAKTGEGSRSRYIANAGQAAGLRSQSSGASGDIVGGALIGAAIGSIVPVIGTAMGAGIGAAIGFAKNNIMKSSEIYVKAAQTVAAAQYDAVKSIYDYDAALQTAKKKNISKEEFSKVAISGADDITKQYNRSKYQTADTQALGSDFFSYDTLMKTTGLRDENTVTPDKQKLIDTAKTTEEDLRKKTIEANNTALDALGESFLDKLKNAKTPKDFKNLENLSQENTKKARKFEALNVSGKTQEEKAKNLDEVLKARIKSDLSLIKEKRKEEDLINAGIIARQAELNIMKQTAEAMVSLNDRSNALDFNDALIENAKTGKTKGLSGNRFSNISQISDFRSLQNDLGQVANSIPGGQGLADKVTSSAIVASDLSKNLTAQEFQKIGKGKLDPANRISAITKSLENASSQFNYLGKDAKDAIISSIDKEILGGNFSLDSLEKVLDTATGTAQKQADLFNKAVEIQNRYIDQLLQANEGVLASKDEEAKLVGGLFDVAARGRNRVSNITEGYATNKSLDNDIAVNQAQALNKARSTLANPNSAGNVGALTRDISGITNKINANSATLQQNRGNEGVRKTLELENQNLAMAAKSAKDELLRLSDQSDRAAEVMGKIERNRVGRDLLKNKAESFVLGDNDERTKMSQEFSGLQQVLAKGTFQGLTPEIRKGVSDLMDEISKADPNGMVAQAKQGALAGDLQKMAQSQGVQLDPKVIDAIFNRPDTKEQQLIGELKAISVQEMAAQQALLDVQRQNTVMMGNVLAQLMRVTTIVPTVQQAVPINNQPNRNPMPKNNMPQQMQQGADAITQKLDSISKNFSNMVVTHNVNINGQLNVAGFNSTSIAKLIGDEMVKVAGNEIKKYISSNGKSLRTA